mgnify:CR=1 FL=1
MKENTKLQIVVIENESIKKMIAKLEDKIQEYKRFIRNKWAPKQDWVNGSIKRRKNGRNEM